MRHSQVLTGQLYIPHWQVENRDENDYYTRIIGESTAQIGGRRSLRSAWKFMNYIPKEKFQNKCNIDITVCPG